jgi:hypothetical protein
LNFYKSSNTNIMRTKQIVNPWQQPGKRHYHRDRRRAEWDEQKDFSNGVDFLPEWRDPYIYERSVNHDGGDWPDEFGNWRQYSESLYTPSHSYGPDRYADDSTGLGSLRHGRAVGYGNNNSPQAEDFENWSGERGRHRNFNDDFRDHEFGIRHGRLRTDNRDFEDGLYAPNYERPYRQTDLANDDHLLRVDRYHNRTGRHLQIVVPFKDDRYYSRNDYNESSGFGSNEMVFHDRDHRYRNDWED